MAKTILLDANATINGNLKVKGNLDSEIYQKIDFNSSDKYLTSGNNTLFIASANGGTITFTISGSIDDFPIGSTLSFVSSYASGKIKLVFDNNTETDGLIREVKFAMAGKEGTHTSLTFSGTFPYINIVRRSNERWIGFCSGVTKIS